MYFCRLIINLQTMENQSGQTTKKGVILLLGIVIGLLIGVLVGFIVESKINPQNAPVVNVVSTNSTDSTDTVFKYIVHQYSNRPGETVMETETDSLQNDSLFLEENSMNFMLDQEDDVVEHVDLPAEVTSEKMVFRHDVAVVFLDSHKNPVETPENAPKSIEVQFWSTPIQNKIVYQFDNNILKIKGLKTDNVDVIHYNNHYYLQSDRQVYPIQQTSDFRRLVETHDIVF